MEPQIRYAPASDGTSIAYWSIGTGPPIVQTPLLPFSHIEMEWQIPELREWYERLARGATLIRYDGRGNGLSQRDAADVSLEAHLRDLEAVVADIGPEPVTLVGVFHTGPAAIAFTARHPDLVSRLVLWCTYAAGTDYWRADQAEGLRALRQADYQLFLRTAAHELVGWDEGRQADRFAEIMLRAVAPEEADRLLAATRDTDVTAELGEIVCPTLVVHRRHLDWLDISLSRGLATGIRGARLSVVDGASPLPGAGETASALAAVDEFLGRGRHAPSAVSGGTVRTILFTDLVGHSAMMSALGDLGGREVLRQHEVVIRQAVEVHGGHEVKALGDGFMVSFDSVTSAVECAIAVQRGVDEWNVGAGRAEAPFLVRVGLQAGEPIEEAGDLFGSSVILASRITEQAAGGEILAGNTVRELCAGKQFKFSDRGEMVAKGFEDPVRIWEVDWRD